MAINVMVVDDSIFVRVLLKDILESTVETEIKVVASVSNGKEAIKEFINNPLIDVVTLDIKMPGIDGIETLKELMKIRRVPVLMISSMTRNGADKTIEALNLGAVDFITKESDEKSNAFYDIKDEIRRKLIAISKIRNLPNTLIKPSAPNKGAFTNIQSIVAIGSSTGGPSALRTVLSGISVDYKNPIIIAQHMPEGNFIKSLASKLNEVTHYDVKEIENGEEIKMNVAYLCPGGYSVEVFKRSTKMHLVLTKKQEGRTIYTPSVDMLFSSIARLDKNIKKTAVVLTGMGDDGEKGAMAIHREGGRIICESEKTAVIYGMPRKVIETGIATYVLDIQKISNYIIRS